MSAGVRPADARAHQDQGTAVSPRAEHDPARFDYRPVQQPDADGLRVLHNHVGDMRAGLEDEVPWRAASGEISIGSRHPDPVTGTHRHPGRAHGAGPVVILGQGEAGSLQCLQAGLRRSR